MSLQLTFAGRRLHGATKFIIAAAEDQAVYVDIPRTDADLSFVDNHPYPPAQVTQKRPAGARAMVVAPL